MSLEAIYSPRCDALVPWYCKAWYLPGIGAGLTLTTECQLSYEERDRCQWPKPPAATAPIVPAIPPTAASRTGAGVVCLPGETSDVCAARVQQDISRGTMQATVDQWRAFYADLDERRRREAEEAARGGLPSWAWYAGGGLLLLLLLR